MSEDQPEQTPAAELDQTLIFGDPATRRKFLKQVAGTGAAIALSSKFVASTGHAAEPVGIAVPGAALRPVVLLAVERFA